MWHISNFLQICRDSNPGDRFTQPPSFSWQVALLLEWITWICFAPQQNFSSFYWFCVKLFSVKTGSDCWQKQVEESLDGSSPKFFSVNEDYNPAHSFRLDGAWKNTIVAITSCLCQVISNMSNGGVRFLLHILAHRCLAESSGVLQINIARGTTDPGY